MITLAVFFVLHGCLGTITDNNVKRLLLNDPDVIAERLTRLESSVSLLATENQQLKAHIQHLETALSDQHGKYKYCIAISYSLITKIMAVYHFRM